MPTVPETKRPAPKVRDVAAPPTRPSDLKWGGMSKAADQVAVMAAENLPGAEVYAAVRDSYSIGKQIGPALRAGDYKSAIAAFLESTAAALGALPAVPSMMGVVRALHGADDAARVAAKEGAAMVDIPDDVRTAVERAKAYTAERNRLKLLENSGKPPSLHVKQENLPTISLDRYTSPQHQQDLYKIANWLDEQERLARSEPGVFWRGTDRKGEHADVRKGKAIMSRNHVTNKPEPGLSVADSPAYIAMSEYKYGYRVRGDIVAVGSDGEPVLANVRPVGPIMPRDQIMELAKPAREAEQARVKGIADALGIPHSEVLRLRYDYGPRPSVERYKAAAERAADGMSALADPQSWVKP